MFNYLTIEVIYKLKEGIEHIKVFISSNIKENLKEFRDHSYLSKFININMPKDIVIKMKVE
ncbi:hypothetical protein [Clostridium sardiniense]|uniref:hypothetical protein n=1 Tax=Clostridium sardiniense TaxID=29369 RepID=UPI003D333D12